jgi:hypothetical protein
MLWSSFRLVLPSIPQGFIFLLLLLAIGLAYGVQARIYAVASAPYDGGWMPALQRTWLGLGTILSVVFALYLFWWNVWLGGTVFAATLFYALRYLPRDRRQQNPLTALSALLNAKARIEAPGIRWVERFCLVGCIFWMLLSTCAFLEKALPLWQPGYTVTILGKEVHYGSKGGPTYTVSMDGWRTPGQRITQRVLRSEYETLTPGQTYRMVTWRGVLGTERLKQFK